MQNDCYVESAFNSQKEYFNFFKRNPSLGGLWENAWIWMRECQWRWIISHYVHDVSPILLYRWSDPGIQELFDHGNSFIIVVVNLCKNQ